MLEDLRAEAGRGAFERVTEALNASTRESELVASLRVAAEQGLLRIFWETSRWELEVLLEESQLLPRTTAAILLDATGTHYHLWPEGRSYDRPEAGDGWVQFECGVVESAFRLTPVVRGRWLEPDPGILRCAACAEAAQSVPECKDRAEDFIGLGHREGALRRLVGDAIRAFVFDPANKSSDWSSDAIARAWDDVLGHLAEAAHEGDYPLLRRVLKFGDHNEIIDRLGTIVPPDRDLWYDILDTYLQELRLAGSIERCGSFSAVVRECMLFHR